MKCAARYLKKYWSSLHSLSLPSIYLDDLHVFDNQNAILSINKSFDFFGVYVILLLLTKL